MDLRESTIGERHPWEQARYRFFSRQLRRAGLFDSANEWLDVGSGDAWFATAIAGHLSSAARVTCWDTGYESVRPSLPRESRVVLTETRPDVRADAILLLDVLEHVEDDRGFLGSLLEKNAAPHAHVLVSVPAWQPLFSAHDTYLKHFRRYSPKQGRALLEEAGLTLLEHGGLFHSLLAPRALTKGIETLRGTNSDTTAAQSQADWHGGRLVTKMVAGTLAAEGRLSEALARAGLSVPGLSWWALARRR